MKKAQNVDEYILNQPKEVRTRLEELRAVIKSCAPEAEEIISYGMAGYKYHGMLVYWGAFANHYSLFGGTGKLSELFKKDLKKYVVSKGTVQFPYDQKLPVSLVKKIVKFRMKENEAKGKPKEKTTDSKKKKG
ncbi:MAG TPA: DUF1801 domain-containing protein, partial [Bacteroidia bacterium]|nr:DUF1801 domain-containing protein [Bacteroidia bacterium]